MRTVVYAEGELPAGATIRKFQTVRFEGKRQVTREIEHYNLEAILAGKSECRMGSGRTGRAEIMA
jgi:hypothetical protein